MKKAPEITKRTISKIGYSHDPYENYKKSKIEWLGKIPKHWEALKLKRLFNVQLGKMLQTEKQNENETKEPYLRAANISWKKPMLEDMKKMWFSPEEKQLYKLQAGDLLINEGGDAGRATLWNGELENCYYQNSINRIRARKDDLTKFLYYWIYALKKNGYIDSICNKATFTHFTAEKVERTPFISPPISEQKAIVKFLDRETSKIDRLIEKQEKLIDLLEEKRTAVITDAVTKGLDQHVEMKESGINWMGEIPSHWNITQLSFLTKCLDNKRIPLNSKERETKKGNYPYWGANGILDHVDDYIYDEQLVLLGEDGAPFFNKKKPVSFVVSGKFWTSNHVHVLRTAEEVNDYFLSHVLNSLNYKLYLKGSTRDKLNQSEMNQIKIQLPPLPEQQKIVSKVDEKTSRFDGLIEDVKTGIQKLKEYRTALISGAVTGKIDVRGEVE